MKTKFRLGNADSVKHKRTKVSFIWHVSDALSLLKLVRNFKIFPFVLNALSFQTSSTDRLSLKYLRNKLLSFVNQNTLFFAQDSLTTTEI